MKQENENVKIKKSTLVIVFGIVMFIIIISSLSNNRGTINSSDNYVIEITGTSGLEFSGSIGGGTNHKTVQGTIPETYEVSDWPAVAVVQKKETYGTLTVTIKKNGRTLNSQTTYADYGIVTVSSG